MNSEKVCRAMEIFVSTGGFKDLDFFEAANLLAEFEIRAFEFSAGRQIEKKELMSKLQKSTEKYKIMLHNYFPPQLGAPVLNLGSLNPEVSESSKRFIRESINLTGELGIDTFGVHAGFLVDPSSAELGNLIRVETLYSRSESFKQFTANVFELSDYAAKKGVKLLVENNVLSDANFKNAKVNFLLLDEPEEILEFFAQFQGEIGFLLDVGHLKVSSQTLGFDLDEAMASLKHLVAGYHLSENNGYADDHRTFGPDAWFLKHLNREAKFATLELHTHNLDDIANCWRLMESITNA